MRGTGQRPLSCCALGWRFKGHCLCRDTVDAKQVHLLPSSGASGQGTTWCTISRVGWQCHTVLTGGCGVPWSRRPLHDKGALPHLPGPCLESSAVGWGVGQIIVVLIFEGTSILFCVAPAPIYIPTNSA